MPWKHSTTTRRSRLWGFCCPARYRVSSIRAASSDARRWASAAADERGAVLVVVAFAMVVLLAMGGLALDSARAYLLKSQLSRAIDAGVLAGARSLRSGQTVAAAQALAMARANGFENGVAGVSMNLTFGTNIDGEQTVRLAAVKPMSTLLMRVLGTPTLSVGAASTAAVPPVDLSLVLDQSGSLASAGAWNDLQQAAKTFVQNFDDVLDQMGLVSFQIRGTERSPLQSAFTATIKSQINAMQSAGDTNAGEGLRLARLQLTGPSVRAKSAKVAVFFTDGRPTAMRNIIGGQDRMMAVYTTTANGRMRGYFDNPNSLPTDQVANPSGCKNANTCLGWTESSIRQEAKQKGIVEANLLRSNGVFIYAIGLGNPNAGNPLLTPDMNYLQQLANENGVSDPSQPKGRTYFAPTAADLQAVFDQVAQDLLVRLAQ